MADTIEEGFDFLFSADDPGDTVEKTPEDNSGKSKAEKPSKSEPDEDEADGLDSEEEEEEEDDSESEDEDSDDESEEEEEDAPKKKGDPEVPLKALRSQVSELEGKVGTYDKMMTDQGFLARQIVRLNPNLVVVEKSQLEPQVDKDGKPVERKAPEAPAYVPGAPFYPNTPEGKADLRIDQRDVMNNILPEVKDNQAVAEMVLGMVATGKSMVDAAHAVKKLMSQAQIDGKKEGKEARDAQTTKKENLSKRPQPGNGKPSQRAELEKRVKSGSESDKFSAGADLLGFG